MTLSSYLARLLIASADAYMNSSNGEQSLITLRSCSAQNNSTLTTFTQIGLMLYGSASKKAAAEDSTHLMQGKRNYMSDNVMDTLEKDPMAVSILHH